MTTSSPYRRSTPGDPPRPLPSDLLRQIGVISATSFMLIASAIGSGLLGGTSVEDLQGGALAEDGSYLAPASPAFSIWSVIYIGLAAYTVWQALPGQRANARQRRIGGWIALSAVFNGLWLVTAQFLTLPLTVLSIVLLLIVLGFTFRLTVRHPADSRWSAWLIDVVTGLHLGWVSLATVANTTAWLTDEGLTVPAPEVWGIIVLAVVAVIGIAVGVISGGRYAPALAIAWGLGWIAYARLTGEPESTPIAIAAISAAVAVLIAPGVIRLRKPARKPEASARVP